MNSEPYAFSPHSQEAEEAALGSILINPDLVDPVAARLTPDAFFMVKNGIVFEAILAVHQRGHAVDVMTVAEELSARGHEDDIGGAYVLYLSNNVPTHIHWESYVDIVERLAFRRRLIAAASDVAQAARQENAEIDDVIAHTEEVIAQATRRYRRRDPVRLRDLSANYFDRTERLANDPSLNTAIPTGFPDLDRILTGGLTPGELILVAARPGMGKTSFCLNVATLAARQRGTKPRQKVGLFSLEMDSERVTERITASLAEIDSTHLHAGTLTDEEWNKYVAALPGIEALPVFIDDTPALSIPAMKAKVSQMQREHGLDLIVVDYLGLMRVPGKVESRNVEVGAISAALKELAREQKVPVLAAAQLNRDVEARQDKTPQLSDLRDSGSLEQDADVILMLYRDDYYHENSARPNETDVYVSKNRNGPTGVCTLLYQKPFTRFVLKAKPELNLAAL